MHRSPFLIVLAAVLLIAGACAQSNPPAPKQSSGTQTGTSSNTGATGAPPPAVPVESKASDTAEEEPQRPKTVILDSSATSAGVLATDGHDPILDPPPLPDGKTTMVGGVVGSVDHIRNRMTVNVFGGGRWKVGFDERTHIFRNGAETTQLAIKKGERVSVDTML
ncbi:MAG TPA: hypothetical protein VG649_04430, partial [Candidatus Angelobacter sp.]|nr:hypothetical protein [Candidatus Angelobacter sp.]